MLTISRTTVADRYLVLRPEGDLDAFSVSCFRRTMVDLADLDNVIIDLSGVTFIDSPGLGALIGGVRRSRLRGRRIGIACDRPGLTGLLHSTGLDSIAALAPSVGGVVEALDERSRYVR